MTNYIPLWLSSTKLGNSTLFQKAGKVGIGTINPGAKLDVAGKIAATDEALSDVLLINSAASNPLYAATSSSTNATAIYGVATSTTGTAFGVEGVTASSGTAYGTVGYAVATSGTPYGVYGLTNSPTAIGVFGQNGKESSTGVAFAGNGLGVGTWGDAGTNQDNIGVLGTADDGTGGWFESNGTAGYTVSAVNNSASGYPGVCSALSRGMVTQDRARRRAPASRAALSAVGWIADVTTNPASRVIGGEPET